MFHVILVVTFLHPEWRDFHARISSLLANDSPIITMKNSADTHQRSIEKKWLSVGVPKRKYPPNSCSCNPHFFPCAFLPFLLEKPCWFGIFPTLAPARHCTGGRTFWMSSYITGSEPSNFRQRWTFMGFSSSSDSARTWLCNVDPSNRTETEGVWGRMEGKAFLEGCLAYRDDDSKWVVKGTMCLYTVSPHKIRFFPLLNDLFLGLSTGVKGGNYITICYTWDDPPKKGLGSNDWKGNDLETKTRRKGRSQ